MFLHIILLRHKTAENQFALILFLTCYTWLFMSDFSIGVILCYRYHVLAGYQPISNTIISIGASLLITTKIVIWWGSYVYILSPDHRSSFSFYLPSPVFVAPCPEPGPEEGCIGWTGQLHLAEGKAAFKMLNAPPPPGFNIQFHSYCNITWYKQCLNRNSTRVPDYKGVPITCMGGGLALVPFR